MHRHPRIEDSKRSKVCATYREACQEFNLQRSKNVTNRDYSIHWLLLNGNKYARNLLSYWQRFFHPVRKIFEINLTRHPTPFARSTLLCRQFGLLFGLFSKYGPEQRIVYSRIIHGITSQIGILYFLTAPGENDKTFLISLTLVTVWPRKIIALAIALFWNAGLLLDGNQIVHWH